MSLCGCFYGKEVATVRSILMWSQGPHIAGRIAQCSHGFVRERPGLYCVIFRGDDRKRREDGLNRTDATELAVQTLVGTARLLDSGMSPENLRKMVTSPGGQRGRVEGLP